MPVPTERTIMINTLNSIGAFIYYALIVTCISVIIAVIVLNIRDWIRTRRIAKYEQEEYPVECILDYPDYPLYDYYPIKDMYK